MGLRGSYPPFIWLPGHNLGVTFRTYQKDVPDSQVPATALTLKDSMWSLEHRREVIVLWAEAASAWQPCFVGRGEPRLLPPQARFLSLLCCRGDKCVFTFPGPELSEMGARDQGWGWQLGWRRLRLQAGPPPGPPSSLPLHTCPTRLLVSWGDMTSGRSPRLVPSSSASIPAG